ncbi:MAG: phosphatase PAP2 family protein [Bacteroidaceae bacterium]|nr:phosphatase PAP2 family protein [Bacteroidaceae bacterium]
MKRICLILSFFLVPLVAVAQQDSTQTDDNMYRFQPKQLIAPAVLLSLGVWGLAEDNPVSWLEEKARSEMNPHSHHCKADEYIQFVPTASHLVLGFIPGVKHRSNFRDRVLASATANLLMAGITNTVKYTVRERRPDSSKCNSFFSGHTATAFTGAELVRIEYGWGYGAAAYAMATSVGFLRVYNKRHWVGDVLAGAGVGILCANAGYWMLPVWHKLFKIDKKKKSKPTVVAAPFYTQEEKAAGLSCSILLE